MESGKILNGLRKDFTNGDVDGWSWYWWLILVDIPRVNVPIRASIPLHIFSMAGYEIAWDLHGKIMDLQISNLSTEDFSAKTAKLEMAA